MTVREQAALIIPPRCLVVFIDDTGHEALASGHPVYALGGCAVMGRDMERLITQPWRELRRRVTGSPDTPLHAHKFSRSAKAGHYDFVAEFFRRNLFWRFGSTITVQSRLSDKLSLLYTMKGVFQQRVAEIVSETLCKNVQLVFESSQRTDAIIEEVFSDLQLFRGSKPIPSECGFMQKSVGEPALEVADFVMHAVGRQARHSLTHRGDFLADFCAVFHSVGPKLAKYLEVDLVTHDPTASVASDFLNVVHIKQLS